VSNAPPVVTIGGDFFAGFAGRRARLRYQSNVAGNTAGATVTTV
jgi:hypothetical protein